MADLPGLAAERERRSARLAAKEEERQRVLTLYRRGTIQIADIEEQLLAIASDTAELAARIIARESRRAGLAGWQAHLNNAKAMLERLRGEADTRSKTDDWEAKRRLVDLLVAGVIVDSEGVGSAKQARIEVKYAFDTHPEDNSTARHGRSRDKD